MNYLRSGLSAVSDALNQAAYIITPVVVGSAVQMSFQDERIGKIVGGVGLTIAGLNLMVISGIPRTLKLWYWNRIDTSNRNSNSSIALRSGVASVGLVTTCYGIYNITMGVLELTTPISCEERLRQAEQMFLSCPEGQKLWEQVESKGPFIVKCASHEEVPSGGRVDLDTREIFISEKHDAIEKSLLFELNNLNRAEIGSMIGQDACQLGADKYATAVESFEYQTALETYRISDRCVNEGFWTENLREFQEEFCGNSPNVDWTSFEGYLKTQENTGHTDLARMRWYKSCDPESLPRWVAKNMDKWKAILKKHNQL